MPQHIWHSSSIITQVAAKWHSDRFALPSLFPVTLAVYNSDGARQDGNKNQRILQRSHVHFTPAEIDTKDFSAHTVLSGFQKFKRSFALGDFSSKLVYEVDTKVRSPERNSQTLNVSKSSYVCELDALLFTVLLSGCMYSSQSQSVWLIKNHAYQNHLSISFNFVPQSHWLIK